MKRQTPKKKNGKPSKWTPKYGDKYYYIMVMGAATFDYAFVRESGTGYDPAHFRYGNRYRTRDEAKAAAKQINDLFRKNK